MNWVDLRLRLRNEIRQLVKRIDVFPDGLRNMMLDLDGKEPKYSDFHRHTLDHFKGVENDPDIFMSKGEYKKENEKSL